MPELRLIHFWFWYPARFPPFLCPSSPSLLLAIYVGSYLLACADMCVLVRVYSNTTYVQMNRASSVPPKLGVVSSLFLGVPHRAVVGVGSASLVHLVVRG